MTSTVAFAQAKIVTGAGAAPPEVKRFNPSPFANDADFTAYSGFNGGVRVAAGDMNGDGVVDIITAPTSGLGPNVNVFNGNSLKLMSSFNAYAPSYTGGVFVGVGDVNHDGKLDIITGPDSGAGPEVKVFSGADGSTISDFFAYSTSFTGGVTVAAGDVNKDGFADIITGAGPGGSPNVRAFSGATGGIINGFEAYSASFTGGVYVAAGDVNGDGIADIITGPGAGNLPEVKVFSGTDLTVLDDFLAFDAGFTGGVRVGAADINGDGKADIIAGSGPGSPPQVAVFSGADLGRLNGFAPYESDARGGVYVAGAVPEPVSALPLLFLLAIVRRSGNSRKHFTRS